MMGMSFLTPLPMLMSMYLFWSNWTPRSRGIPGRDGCSLYQGPWHRECSSESEVLLLMTDLLFGRFLGDFWMVQRFWVTHAFSLSTYASSLDCTVLPCCKLHMVFQFLLFWFLSIHSQFGGDFGQIKLKQTFTIFKQIYYKKTLVETKTFF